jgi:hypothetical protein
MVFGILLTVGFLLFCGLVFFKFKLPKFSIPWAMVALYVFVHVLFIFLIGIRFMTPATQHATVVQHTIQMVPRLPEPTLVTAVLVEPDGRPPPATCIRRMATGLPSRGAGYNAYTGRNYGYQYGHSYNSVTGAQAVGERGGVQNVYNGNYAYGGHGAGYNPNTDMAAAGSKYTVGNSYSGKQATVGRGEVSGPGGQTTSVSGIKGSDGGGAASVGGHTIAADDGNIYRQGSDGSWNKFNSSGGWDNVQNLDQNRSLNSAVGAQNFGSQQAGSWVNHGWQDGGGRSFGGGAGAFGGGGGFGGFPGGGFGGSRR